MTSPKVVVLGSAHIDLIASAPRLPGAGNSVLGDRFVTAPGGKAANQAAQMARCGASVALISRLGDDVHGEMIRAALRCAGVSLELLVVDRTAATGASVVFAAAREYASVIVPGAAGRLSPADIDASTGAIQAADALLLQLEVPASISAAAAEIARHAGVSVVLNASPASGAWETLPQALRDAVSIVVVNRREAELLLGGGGADAGTIGESDEALARDLNQRTNGSVILTLGAGGAIASEDGALTQVPAFSAEAVDTIGAGDAFLGAFLTARLGGQSLFGSLERGAAAGAIAVTKSGALRAQPSKVEIDAFLQGRRQTTETRASQ